MPASVDAFLAEVRAMPRFIAASRTSHVWAEHVNAIEYALHVLYKAGDDNADAVELLDEICAIVGDKQRGLGERILQFHRLLSDHERALREMTGCPHPVAI
jgi:hypothetical protein